MKKVLRDQVAWCAKAQWVMGICALGLLLGFYLVGYAPASRRLKELDNQIERTRSELSATQGKADTLQLVVQEVQRLKEKLDSSKKLPAGNDLPTFIKDVDLISQRSSLRGYSSNVLIPKRNDTYWQMPVELKFEGDFTNVFSFLQKTEARPQLTRVTRLELKSKDKEPGQVQATVTLNIYYLAD
jgi:Tfp pilus assembly protein PilO